MSSVDSLPQDQRAVLQLVLSRGRSYDQIAQLLKINPASVRERAHAALSTLGPETEVSSESRGRISDYLLGQQSDPSEAAVTRDLLARSPGDRAWARVVASEIAPLAAGELPEIPTESDTPQSDTPQSDTPQSDTPQSDTPQSDAPQPTAPAPAAAVAARAPAVAAAEDADGTDADAGGDRPRSSRLGGIIVLAGVVIAVAVVLFFVLRSNGNSPKHAAVASSTTASTPAASATTTTSSSSSATSAKVVAQINLTPPHTGSKAVGIAEVLDEGTNQGVAIVAQNVPPNSTKPPNAYAVWLYNSPTDAHILGFVNPGVGANGRLSTAGALPPNVKHYKKLIVTVETDAKPKTPGTIILQGALAGL